MRLERKPRLYDLFCGAGGASKGFQDAGFHVVGVDKTYQPNYCGDAFIKYDAIKFLEEGGSLAFTVDEADGIVASPPCQRFSSKTFDPERHEDLITPLRPLLEKTGLPWIMENVFGAPLKDPIRLCGSSFGLDVRRHRYFESNFALLDLPCRHAWQKPRYYVYDHGDWYYSRTVPVFGEGGGKARQYWGKAMGIDWMTDDELREAIPPKYTEYLGHQLRSYIEYNTLTRLGEFGLPDEPCTHDCRDCERAGRCLDDKSSERLIV